MDADLIIARLKDRAPGLGQRVFGAAEFARLTANAEFPQVTPAAHVVSTGIAGDRHQAQLGFFVQHITRLFSVILTLRSQDASGARALTKIDALVTEIIEALAGWELGDRLGVIILRRAALMHSMDGVFAYEISFSIADQLRIIPS